MKSPQIDKMIPAHDSHDWNDQVEELLVDWRQRVYAAQSAHYAATDHYRRLNYLIGVPAIIFSSVVGTAIFASLNEHAADQNKIIVAIISIAAAVLSALQTFLRFSERATQHATAADWYSAIRRDIEQTLHLAVGSRGSPKDCLDRIRKEINRVGQNAPELKVSLWQREAKRFGVKEVLNGP